MPEQPLTHEVIERAVKTEPLRVLSTLPDCVESREAKRLVEIVDGLAHQAREKVQPA